MDSPHGLDTIFALKKAKNWDGVAADGEHFPHNLCFNEMMASGNWALLKMICANLNGTVTAFGVRTERSRRADNEPRLHALASAQAQAEARNELWTLRTRKLLVVGLLPITTVQEIISYFSRWGTVRKVFLSADSTTTVSNYAFVCYTTYGEVEAAMACVLHVISGKLLTVCRAALCLDCVPSERQNRYQMRGVTCLVCCLARSRGLAKAKAALLPPAPVGHYYFATVYGVTLPSLSSDRSARHAARQDDASSEWGSEDEESRREWHSLIDRFRRQIITGRGRGQTAERDINREQSSSVRRSGARTAWNSVVQNVRAEENEDELRRSRRSGIGENLFPARFVPGREDAQRRSSIVEESVPHGLGQSIGRSSASFSRRTRPEGNGQMEGAIFSHGVLQIEPGLD
ncbi:unnamed protein product [Gongylonema pulchrum]|uniref:RRM domain-containing protein n=1 Tax=Gongylonema pulchrum TaxID=637853 RepID=A0A183DXS7_9BILA|nr:unnamed protein product [Gongylonema pulchrum]